MTFGLIARYLPALALATGAIVNVVVTRPSPTALRHPLSTAAPAIFMGAAGTDLPIQPDEVDASGVSDYLNRVYRIGEHESVNLYIGYHATQQGDKRMHSPSLCLPGSGWTPIAERTVSFRAGSRDAMVNRFILQNAGRKILVYYWFQGRGRLTAGQSALKLNAIKDALLTHRDEEALVRIIVPLGARIDSPIGPDKLKPDDVAMRLAATVIQPLDSVLPAAP